MSTDAVEQVIERFFVAVEAGDLDTVASMYADDIAVWHSVTGRTIDKAASLAILRWMHGPGVVMRYEPQEHLIVGDRVSRRHLLHVAVPGCDELTIPVSIYFTVRGGLLTSIEEYVDAKASDQLIATIPRGA